MKKIKLTESDLYRIVRRVLLEQEEEKRSITFSPGAFKSLITTSSCEGFVRTLNNKYDEIVIDGDLDLSETDIKILPNNFIVGGGLDLRDTPIQSLPDNLHVEGDLSLIAVTEIESLPDNLYVGGDLSLAGTFIQSLPDNLDVKGIIFIAETALVHDDKLVKKYEKKYTIDRY